MRIRRQRAKAPTTEALKAELFVCARSLGPLAWLRAMAILAELKKRGEDLA